MTGRLNSSREALSAQLTTAGLVVIDDPRNARPNAVIINPPTVTTPSFGQPNATLFLEFQVDALCPPPGNLDALKALLDAVDTVMNTVAVISAVPSVYTVGNQELPSYTITVNYPA
jgi:hypothetical protein